MNPTPPSALPDHASESDARLLAIDKVGIKDLSYPIQVMDRNNAVQHTVANVNLYVSLPHHFKGTHMSRFIEVLHAHRGEMTLRSIPAFLSDIQRRLEADDAHVELSFPYFMAKRAPVSGVESLMEYRCTFRASRRGPTLDFVLAVRVPVKSLCPCSKAISERGAHNQRSLVDVEVRSSEFIWIEDVVAAVEACGSAPLFALLKREDEKYVTELAYDNPKFVEDLVRDAVIAIRKLPGVNWLRVSAENQESIHNHSAYAQIEWSDADVVSVGERAPGADPGAMGRRDPLQRVDGPAEAFGPWLRQLRTARGFSQQALADHLGVSPAHLSRVESGEKRLSEDGLRRVSALLGVSPVEAALRAGVLPSDVAGLLNRHARAFEDWLATLEAAEGRPGRNGGPSGP
jgi:GTP cyclohydrolase I